MSQLSLDKIHSFDHKAMATVFEIYIYNEDQRYARQAADEAFQLVDRLEQDLSRYIENSDISRINNLKIGESTIVSLDTFECLKQCIELYQLTNGAFDVTVGHLLEVWLNEDNTLRQPTPEDVQAAAQKCGLYHLALEEGTFRVTMKGGPVSADLGGFGKGYAVDQMAALMREFELHSYVIHSGKSSVLAGAPPGESEGWPLTLSNPFQQHNVIKKLLLQNQAVSGSGLQKGRHIIDPRTARPLKKDRAAWAFAPDAAFSDGLSTAFMILDREEIASICQNRPDVRAAIIKNKPGEKDQILFFGDWQE